MWIFAQREALGAEHSRSSRRVSSQAMRGSRSTRSVVSCIGAARAFTISSMRALPWLAVCACNHIPVAPPVPALATSATAATPFAVPDEAMEFRVSLRGITVGLVQTAIGQPGWVDGKRAIIARSRGKSDGLAALLGDITWELQTTVDLGDGLPIEDREEAWVAFAGEQEHHVETHAADGDHDVHSIIGEMRGWTFLPDTRREARVRLGGAHLPVVVWPAAKELVADKPAIRYDGRVRDQLPFELWISDDAAHVPLAFRTDTPLGEVAVELTDYRVTP